MNSADEQALLELESGMKSISDLMRQRPTGSPEWRELRKAVDILKQQHQELRQRLNPVVNFETNPEAVRELTSHLVDWIDDDHFEVTEYLHASTDEFADYEIDEFGNQLFGQEFVDAYHYRLYEVAVKIRVDAHTGEYEIVKVWE